MEFEKIPRLRKCKICWFGESTMGNEIEKREILSLKGIVYERESARNMVNKILQSVNNGSLLAVFCFPPPETEEGARRLAFVCLCFLLSLLLPYSPRRN